MSLLLIFTKYKKILYVSISIAYNCSNVINSTVGYICSVSAHMILACMEVYITDCLKCCLSDYMPRGHDVIRIANAEMYSRNYSDTDKASCTA